MDMTDQIASRRSGQEEAQFRNCVEQWDCGTSSQGKKKEKEKEVTALRNSSTGRSNPDRSALVPSRPSFEVAFEALSLVVRLAQLPVCRPLAREAWKSATRKSVRACGLRDTNAASKAARVNATTVA